MVDKGATASPGSNEQDKSLSNVCGTCSCGWGELHLVKVDVEGAELAVLRGLQEATELVPDAMSTPAYNCSAVHQSRSDCENCFGCNTVCNDPVVRSNHGSTVATQYQHASIRLRQCVAEVHIGGSRVLRAVAALAGVGKQGMDVHVHRAMDNASKPSPVDNVMLYARARSMA
jgi:Pyruvate/2-oxoacid:ferredoxin oxidoreductase delta subunit